jgi:tRNA(Ile)-lysidine synthase
LRGQGALVPARDAIVFDAAAFAGLPEEIRLRLLMRAVNRFGHEGPAELAKVEKLLEQLDRSFTDGLKGKSSRTSGCLKQTLAGALVSLSSGELRITPAPARRKVAARS